VRSFRERPGSLSGGGVIPACPSKEQGRLSERKKGKRRPRRRGTKRRSPRKKKRKDLTPTTKRGEKEKRGSPYSWRKVSPVREGREQDREIQ